ncbi:MAG: GNAT family protein [Pseudomonadota bacterium]
MTDHLAHPAQIQTSRLVLRPPAAGDAAAIAGLCNDAHLARMTARVPHPYAQSDAEAFLAYLGSSEDEAAFGLWADGELAGMCGLSRLAEDVYELGYWVGAPWRGQGIAREAAEAVVAFAWRTLKARLLEAGHYADNPISGRILTACGFAPLFEADLWSEGRQAKADAIRYAATAWGAPLDPAGADALAMRARVAAKAGVH